MIKINLLPVPKSQRKSKVEFKIGLPIAILAWGLIFLSMLFYNFKLANEATMLSTNEVQLQDELARIKTLVEDVKNYEKLKEEVMAKIGIIDRLRGNQLLPVHVLDDLSRSLPDRVWMISLDESNNAWIINGKAVSNIDIVDLINNMKNSQYFTEIKLLESIQAKEQEIPIYNFKLHFKAGKLPKAA